MPRSRRRCGPWAGHPGIRSGDQLTLGERAADRLRNGMGSWTFVLAALVFLGVRMTLNGTRGFDPYPFILLNLVLSCLAALQGAILLIAARRSDQIAGELARHDHEAATRTRDVVERLGAELAALRADQLRLHGALVERLGPPPALPEPTPEVPATTVRGATVLPMRRRTSGAATTTRTPVPTTEG